MWKYTLNRCLATFYPDWMDNTIRMINGARRLYWKELSTDSLRDNYRTLIYDKPFNGHETNIDDNAVLDSFKFDNDKVQREYFLEFPEEVVFSPRYGWAMTRKGEIVVDSLPYTYYALLPGLQDYFSAVHPPRDARTFDRLVSFRDIGDKNYYHFYNDHLVKFAILKKMGIDDTPILVSKILYSKPFFQEAVERSGLQDRQWVVQDKDYVVAKKSYFCGTMPITKEYLEYVLAFLKPPKPNPNVNRRIFINRDKAAGRCIANISEIETVVSELGFESVNLEGLSLSEQMKLFSEAGTVVGIHGAGLTNIIFRAGAPLNLIEIFPPNNIPAMFYWITCRFGFRYDAIVGYQKLRKRSDRQPYAKIEFYLDPERLGKKIKEITCPDDGNRKLHSASGLV